MVGLPVVKLPGWIQTIVANGSGALSKMYNTNKIKNCFYLPLRNNRVMTLQREFFVYGRN